MPQSLCRRVLYWYHFYLNHPGGSRVKKTTREVCYWKGLVTKAELFSKIWYIRQHFKKRRTLYGHLPHKNTAELKPWGLMHIDLIGPYRKSIIQQQPGGAIIQKNASLNWMTMIEPTKIWFEISKILKFNFDEVTTGNYECINKSSARVIQLM